MERLIRDGADLNAVKAGGVTPLHVTASGGDLAMVRLLLRDGALPNARDTAGQGALHHAAVAGHYMVVGELLRAGADGDAVDDAGYQALHAVIWTGHDTTGAQLTVRVLVAAGVALNHRSGTENLLPADMAEQRGNHPQAALLHTAASPPVTDPPAKLLTAAATGDLDGVVLALRAGARLEHRASHTQSTALMETVLADHVDVARVLIASGADPDAVDYRGDTPWVMTGVTGSVAMLEALLPANPDLARPNRRGGTPAHPAAERGHVDYIHRIVELPVDLNRVNLNGWTALLEAVVFGDGGPGRQDIVRTLLAAGADPTITDANGATALDHARARGFTAIAALLGG